MFGFEKVSDFIRVRRLRQILLPLLVVFWESGYQKVVFSSVSADLLFYTKKSYKL